MTGWTAATVSLVSLAVTLTMFVLICRQLRRIMVQRELVIREAERFQQLVGQWQQQFHAPSCERCGRPFLQTGPKDWEHLYCPAAP